MGSCDEPFVPGAVERGPAAIVERHDSGTDRDRVVSVVLAGHRGDAATVRSGLQDPDPGVRSAAVAASLRLAATRIDTIAAATADVVVALRDDDASVRRRAAVVAARLGSLDAAVTPRIPELADALVALLTDADDRVVEVAAFACGELPLDDEPATRGRVVVALCGIATDHEDRLCRESAVASLGSIGDPAALSAVLHACEDRGNVRRRAVLALAAFDDPAATDALERLTGDRDLQVRQAAEELLAIESGEAT